MAGPLASKTPCCTIVYKSDKFQRCHLVLKVDACGVFQLNQIPRCQNAIGFLFFLFIVIYSDKHFFSYYFQQVYTLFVSWKLGSGEMSICKGKLIYSCLIHEAK